VEAQLVENEHVYVETPGVLPLVEEEFATVNHVFVEG
jgi:hypothetical protein